MPLQLEDYLPNLEDSPMAVDGRPVLLPLDLIDEDPLQPRSEFDAEALGALAKTIGARGVLQPVSVRSHPNHTGRWMLNFGARRLRATRLAGRTEIPAFVDETADSFDQVTENEQRENLQPLELALFVQRQLQTGTSQAEIARRLGKTRGYLTFVGALIDPPDWLLELYRAGRCKGLKELYDLRKLSEVRPAGVQKWLHERSEVSRADVELLKKSLADSGAGLSKAPASSLMPASAPPITTLASSGSPHAHSSREVNHKKPPAAIAMPVVLEALHQGERVTIDLTEIPDEDDFVFVFRQASVKRMAVRAADLRLVRALHRDAADE
jgi:ParB family chromosome partitioning protein